MSASDETQLVDLVASVLDRLDRGEDPRIDDVCREHPDWADRIREAVHTASEIDEFDVSGTSEGLHEGRFLRGRYRLEASIGSGSMGAVYTAWDEELDRPVAVKLLQSDIWDGPEAQARFEREARALAAVRHPSVVTIHDRGQTADGLQFLVMELLVGSGLDAILRDAQIGDVRDGSAIVRAARQRLGDGAELEGNDFRQVATWARDIADGLQTAHRAGVLHRDVKPSNVFIRSNGAAVLIDFGIASDRADRTLATGGAVLGTPAYMPPEALRPGHDASATTDVYGLGATLYHLVTLRQPFEGTPSQVLEQLPHREPPAIDRVRNRVPRDLRAIIDQSMSRVRRKRYPDAAGVADDLRAFLNHQPVRARPRTTIARGWTRVSKSTAFRTAVAVGILALSTWAVFESLEARRVRSHQQFESALRTLPPSLLTATVGPQRHLGAEAVVAIDASLEQLLASGAHAALARGYRGFARLGLGDAAAAVHEFEFAHDHARDPVFADLASRATDVDGEFYAAPLAAATTTAGEVMRAIHRLQCPERDGSDDDGHSVREAIELLGNSKLEDVPGVANLRLMSRGVLLERSRAVRRFDADNALQQMYAEALRLESRFGGPSPTTALVRGNVLLHNGRIEIAVSALREAATLCPTSASIRTTLAGGLSRRGRFEEAVAELTVATRLRPRSVKIWRRLVRALASAARFEEARRELQTEDPELEGERDRHRPRLRGVIATKESLAAFVRGDAETSREIAARAIAEWSAADATSPTSLRSDVDFARLYYLAQGNRDKVLQFLLSGLRIDPLNRRALQSVRKLLPSRGSIDASLFGAYLDSLLENLNPDRDE